MNHVVCLSGWAQPHYALDVIAPHAQHLEYGHLSMEEAVQAVGASSPDLAIGWSLGGVLLMLAKAQGLINPQAMVLLGAPMQFVSDDDFPHGMGQETFARFYENMCSQPERSAEKFNHLIAYEDVNFQHVLQALQDKQQQRDWGAWVPWLDLLQQQHRDGLPYGVMGKTLLIYGDTDIIVPHEQGKLLAKHMPKSSLEIIAGCAHAPHLHDSNLIQRLILEHTGYDLQKI